MQKEEELIKKILFEENLEILGNINFNKFVEISSKHLLIPVLYVKLKKSNKLKVLPAELVNYFREIYNINRRKNIILIKELHYLSKIFNHNKIDHVFIKGAANIVSKVFFDIGERMVGDIDVLIDEKNKDFCENILERNGYKNIKYSFFENRHLTRKVNKKKMFSLEVHTKVINEPKKVNNNLNFLENKLVIDNLKVPNIKNQILNLFYSDQLNDNHFYFLSYHYRSIYDLNCLLTKFDGTNFNFDRYINNFLMITKKLNIKNNIYNNNNYSFNEFRFDLGLKNRLYRKIEKSFLRLFFKFFKIPKQILELITNSEYRLYIKKKLFNF